MQAIFVFFSTDARRSVCAVLEYVIYCADGRAKKHENMPSCRSVRLLHILSTSYSRRSMRRRAMAMEEMGRFHIVVCGKKRSDILHRKNRVRLRG